MIQAYLNYLFKDLPSHTTPNAFDVVDNFFFKIFQWTIFFTTIFLLAKFLGPKLAPKWYSRLTPRKIREYPSYIICTIHHLWVVPHGWIHLITDLQRDELQLQNIHYVLIEAKLVPFIYGYFLADLICYALPEFINYGSIEYVLHHVMTAYLLYTVMFGSGHLLKYGPHLIICDTANIFFSIAWLMRTSERLKNWKIVYYFELLFVICYFFHRVINLPLALYAVYNTPLSGTMGYGKYTFFPIVFLQWFWFYKIVASLGTKGSAKQKKNNDSKAGKDQVSEGEEEEENNNEEVLDAKKKSKDI